MRVIRALGGRSKFVGAAVLVVLALAACNFRIVTPTGTSTPTQNTTGVPRFEKGACPFDVGASSPFVQGKNLTCGVLVVRANRSDPSSSTLRLAVAILKSPSARPAPDPVIFLQGGPGGRLLQDWAPAFTQGQIDLQTQFGNHDLIMIDQRGTGYSKPSLQCSELVNLYLTTDLNVTPSQAVDLQNKALAQCHTRLTGEGINLGDYTVASDAADIHDLIQVLGYAQVDLYGVSYGTRLALEIMRAFPQHVRSVILDSTVPPQLKLLTNLPAATARIFDVLFKGCAADSFCNSHYPQLDSVFYSLVSTMNQHPITFQSRNPADGKGYTVLFHGDDLVNLVFEAFYETDAIPLIPQMISQVQKGDYTHLLSRFYGILVLYGIDGINWGTYFSVECAEDVDFLTTQDLVTAAQAYPQPIRTDQLISIEGEIGACQNWNVKAVDAAEANPVTSAIPTLIVEAEYDPITPPSNGDLVARTLSKSYTFLFPGVGHGAFLLNSCPTQVGLAFLSNPNQKPDGSCIASMTEPQFQ